MSSEDLTKYLDEIPSPTEIRRKLSANLREAKLLRQLLKISDQREKVREASSCK